MRGEQRAELQAKLPAHVGIGAALRDAGLRSIGREDLVLESRDESGHRKPGRSEAEFVTAVVYMTREQKQAMDAFAKSSGRSRSALMVDALRAELGLEPAEADDALGGWQRGKRRSRKPPR
jgi:hypothetical protein